MDESAVPDPMTIEVASRWPTWYPALAADGGRLMLVRADERAFSTVHEYEIVTGSGRTRFFAKQPNKSGGRRDNRPYSVAIPPIDHRHARQADALTKLRRAVDPTDPTIAAVRVVAVVDDPGFLVTEAALGQTLHALALDLPRWSPHQFRDLGPAFTHAGRLLRVFHERVEPSGPRSLGTRRDLLDTCRVFAAHLEDSSRSARWLDGVCRQVSELATRHLPSQLEPVARFGDYGLTNILATDGHQVTAIDTLAVCRVPALHDLTNLTTELQLLRPQVATLGLAVPVNRLDRLERRFLSGYHGEDPHSVGAHHTWSILRALEQWSAKRVRHPTGPVRWSVDRFLRIWIDRRLRAAFDAT